jgi:hypothetical protein
MFAACVAIATAAPISRNSQPVFSAAALPRAALDLPALRLPPVPVMRLGPRAQGPSGRVYVSVNIDSQVAIFEQRSPHYEVGAIFGLLFPSSVDVDDERNIYVSDQIEDVIDIFKPNALEPTTFLYDNGQPIDVKVDSRGQVAARDRPRHHGRTLSQRGQSLLRRPSKHTADALYNLTLYSRAGNNDGERSIGHI